MAPPKGLTGGNEANTEAIINAQVEQANKAVEALKKKQPKKTAPKKTGSPMAMIKAQQEADASYNWQYHMSYEEYMIYEEEVLPLYIEEQLQIPQDVRDAHLEEMELEAREYENKGRDAGGNRPVRPQGTGEQGRDEGEHGEGEGTSASEVHASGRPVLEGSSRGEVQRNDGGLSKEAGQDADIAEAWTKAKEKNPDRVALVRIGDNYVAYGADASVCADVLNIGTKAVADRRLERKAEFPHEALDIYLQKLISKGNKVAIFDNLNGGNTVPTESVTPKAEAQENNPLPIGRGAFGDIYDAFKGKARKAFDFLLRKKSGDLLGVFHRDGVGYIDLVWGDKGGGFDHIVSKHVGEGKSFSTVDEAAIVIDDIIKTGKKDFEDGDKIVFKKGSKLVTIRKNVRENGKKIADKNWVLTAYDELSADGDVSAIAPTNKVQAARHTDETRGKGTKKNGNSQEKAEKNVDEPIEDVGEKIGGARKDLYKGMQERAAEAAKQTDDELINWMKVLYHKADGVKALSPEEQVLRDALDEVMQKNGLDVIGSEAGQRVLDEANGEVKLEAKRKRALETVSVSRDEEHQQTVISSADGAKVLNNSSFGFTLREPKRAEGPAIT